MREQPTGEMLLQAARDALKSKVLPLLQGDAAADAKREVLMVMNALSIAQRELQMGSEPDAVERESLSGLLGASSGGLLNNLFAKSSAKSSGDSAPDMGSDNVSDIAQANRELAMRIRTGFADPETDAYAKVFAHLRLVGKCRLQASNPKVLGASKP